MATTVPAGGMLGRYQVLKPLAKGGMAEVLLARALGLAGFARYVVIKRIRVENVSDQKAIDMFLDEARLVASLHHRNIVQVLDVGEEEGKYFFVMEYVHGRDARELLRKVKDEKQQLPLEHVISIATAAAAGLHYAHEQRGPDRRPLGIVHRDISPGNILVAFDGGVKVVDFGIAKAHARAADTQAGETKGKVGYMAPEQCRAQPVDRRTDVFQLGIVLWELCTVKRLFNKEGRFETMAMIADGEVPPPSKFRADLPPELEQIVMKALAKSPDERFASADELRLALEGFAARAGLTLSAGRLSDYLKTLFGEVPEPWLVEDIPPPAPEVIERVRTSQRIEVPALQPAAETADVPTGEPEPPAAETADVPTGEPEPPAPEPPAPEPPAPEPPVAAAPPPVPATTTQPELAALRAAKPVIAGEPSNDDDAIPVARRDTPVSWPVDPSSVRARKRWLIALGVLAAGVIAFLIAAFWGPDVPPPPATSPAPVAGPAVVADAAEAEPASDAASEPAAVIDAGAEDLVADAAVAEGAGSAAPTVDAGVPATSPADGAVVEPTRSAPKPTKPKRPRPRPRAKPAANPAAKPATPPLDNPAEQPVEAAGQPAEPRRDVPSDDAAETPPPSTGEP